MFKEIKYFIFLSIITFFIILIVKYYFSDENKKNSFTSLIDIDKKIKIFAEKLPVLEDDTKNIIEYVERSNTEKRKKFNFGNY